MLTMDIRHPDILEFIESKQDLTKLTGANISVKVTDDFMKAVREDKDFVLRFPCDTPDQILFRRSSCDNLEEFCKGLEYNKLYNNSGDESIIYVKIVKAKELWNKLIHCAWNTAEPGIIFIDQMHNYAPDGIYPKFKAISTNPCGEIGMGANDSCRLIHINLTKFVDKPFTSRATFQEDLFKETVYKATFLADDLIDLEMEYIDRIIDKVSKEKEDDDREELGIWKNIKKTTSEGRRAGLGSLGIADVFAMLGVKYGSPKSKEIAERINFLKMEAELKAQIHLAKSRGAFPAYNHPDLNPLNMWEKFVKKTYPELWEEMAKVGRRNISWSTMAPTGSLAILAGVSSGIEPVFMPYYTRRRKCSSSEDIVHYVDKNGQKYSEFVVVHPMLKKWYETIYHKDSSAVTIDEWKNVFPDSPYYQSTAEEIDWNDRIEIQRIFQVFTTHSISSTINLPKETTEDEISQMYQQAWEVGLKGLTVYRAGCREGVLNSLESQSTKDRPKELEADYYQIKAKGTQYIVVVGLLNGEPYEVFTFKPNFELNLLKAHKGVITKVGKGQYHFNSDLIRITNMELATENELEKAVTIMASYSLRDRVPINEVIKRIRKIDDLVVSFSSAICRILAKYSTSSETSEICPECGGRMVREGGCEKCLDCAYSKCL